MVLIGIKNIYDKRQGVIGVKTWEGHGERRTYVGLWLHWATSLSFMTHNHSGKQYNIIGIVLDMIDITIVYYIYQTVNKMQ